VPVAQLADLLVEAWPGGRWTAEPARGPAEAPHLALDSGKAAARLGWRPRLSLREAVSATVAWYRRALSEASPEAMFDLSLSQIAAWEGARR
jgi:CDP-glucose 4,6-dehydratase